MPRIRPSERFKKAYRGLPAEIRSKIDKAIRLLAENPRHPSLQTKPIQGATGVYEARVDINYRITYRRQPGDILELGIVAKHDEALKNP
jgi:mRNA-degrading endonuclease RelE of RelBE toxin-antitoxin system